MKKIWIGLLCFALVSFAGCGTIKKVFGGGDQEKEETPRVAPPSSEKVKITTTTLSNWALYAAITLSVLFGVRYGVKKIANKKE